MDRFLALLCSILGVVIFFITFPEGNAAILVAVVCASPVVFAIHKIMPESKQFLTRVFLIGLLARLSFGLVIHVFELREFFGGDALAYDKFGNILMETWFRAQNDGVLADGAGFSSGVGWGMLYMVAGIYTFTGQNILAVQFFCAVIGAAIAPLLYVCSSNIFENRRVSQVAAVLAAVFPAFVIWTGQLLKDGIVIFLLVTVMIMVIELQKKFSYLSLLVLLLSLFAILSLRFYIFYMIVIAVIGTFLVGLKGSSQSILARILVLILIGVGLTYLGVIRNASSSFDTFGSLERIQISRQDLSTADSGFGKDVDVSTMGGAISALPIGLTYLFLAPFPWSVVNFRQAITLPDILLWYASIPFLILGLFYSMKYRLRSSLGILTFSLMLSFGYALFQGNVGTAYRQRCQIQVFLFIFVGVGWTLFQERRENRKNALRIERRRFDARLKANETLV